MRPSTIPLLHQRLLTVLAQVAADDRPCPTNAALAEAVGADTACVGHALKTMCEHELIAVETVMRARRVTIASTGAQTAPVPLAPRSIRQGQQAAL